jgi:uncharacterized protein (TIGR02246 family)
MNRHHFGLGEKNMMPSSKLLLTLSLILQAAPALQAASPEDEKAIRQSAARYAEAYSRGDVDALVAQYAPDADYDDGSEAIKGRDAIRKNLEQDLAKQPGVKMTIEVKSVRFARSRAVETGVATLTPKEGDPIVVPYRAIHAKQPDGKWLITSVGPDVSAEGAGSMGPLEQLEWMIGTWEDVDDNVTIKSVCSWTPGRRFILRSFTVNDDEGTDMTVSEVIGWDAGDRVVRSWVFDTEGGTAQNTWSRRGDDWIILAKGTLPDGAKASAVNMIHPIDQNSFTWSSTNREVDGEKLPDVEDIKMVRVAQTQPAGAAAQGEQP